MSFNRISAERNTYESGNENGYGNGIISPVFRERLRERSVAFLLCEMPENGLCISAGEDVVLKVHLELRHECVGICCSGPAEECGAPCLRSLGTRVRCFEGQERILLPDALCATVKTTEGVIKTIKENRAEVSVLKTHDTWFGVTYQEDKEMVMKSFKDLEEKGVYKNPLFA